MYEYNVYVNEEFTDKYNGELYPIGSKIEGLSEERVNEINAVKKGLISVISKEKVIDEEDKVREEELKALRAEIEHLKANKETLKTAKANKDQNE